MIKMLKINRHNETVKSARTQRHNSQLKPLHLSHSKNLEIKQSRCKQISSTRKLSCSLENIIDPIRLDPAIKLRRYDSDYLSSQQEIFSLDSPREFERKNMIKRTNSRNKILPLESGPNWNRSDTLSNLGNNDTQLAQPQLEQQALLHRNWLPKRTVEIPPLTVNNKERISYNKLNNNILHQHITNVQNSYCSETSHLSRIPTSNSLDVPARQQVKASIKRTLLSSQSRSMPSLELPALHPHRRGEVQCIDH